MDDSQECRSQRARCTVPRRCGCHLAVIGCRQKGQLSGHFARLQRSHTCRAPLQAQQAAWEVHACMTQSDSDFRCTLHHVSTVRLCNILAPNIINACKDFKNAISMTQLPQSMVPLLPKYAILVKAPCAFRTCVKHRHKRPAWAVRRRKARTGFAAAFEERSGGCSTRTNLSCQQRRGPVVILERTRPTSKT